MQSSGKSPTEGLLHARMQRPEVGPVIHRQFSEPCLRALASNTRKANNDCACKRIPVTCVVEGPFSTVIPLAEWPKRSCLVHAAHLTLEFATTVCAICSTLGSVPWIA